MTEYLIWSHEHAAWWGPDRCGYFRDVARAGRYSRTEALTICAAARGGWRPGDAPNEHPVLEADAMEIEEAVLAGRAQR